MKILGNRILVSMVEEPEIEGYKEVEMQNSFLFKGKIEQIGYKQLEHVFSVGDVVLFSKYSPDTQEVDIERQTMKIINTEDVLAIL